MSILKLEEISNERSIKLIRAKVRTETESRCYWRSENYNTYGTVIGALAGAAAGVVSGVLATQGISEQLDVNSFFAQAWIFMKVVGPFAAGGLVAGALGGAGAGYGLAKIVNDHDRSTEE